VRNRPIGQKEEREEEKEGGRKRGELREDEKEEGRRCSLSHG